MTAQERYDSIDGKQNQDLLMKIGETREEARILSQRDYFAFRPWTKNPLNRYWR